MSRWTQPGAPVDRNAEMQDEIGISQKLDGVLYCSMVRQSNAGTASLGKVWWHSCLPGLSQPQETLGDISKTWERHVSDSIGGSMLSGVVPVVQSALRTTI